MNKLVPLHQVMEVEKVFRDVKVGGKVTKSNFLEEGERHMFPLHEEVADIITEGQKLRITFYSLEDDVEQGEGQFRFKSKGVKYELWNEENKGWDQIFEKMRPQEDEA
jgi:hypothetical protein